MIENGKAFRIQIRFNKIEYDDLYRDLLNYQDSNEQANRIRKLLRVGLAALNDFTVEQESRVVVLEKTPGLAPKKWSS